MYATLVFTVLIVGRRDLKKYFTALSDNVFKKIENHFGIFSKMKKVDIL